MIIGLPKEIKNNEFRVGLIPGNVSDYVQAGHTVLVEKGAGLGSGFTDQEYEDAGAVSRTSTFALANATLPYGLKLASQGVEAACAADKGLMEGLNCYDGKCTYPGVAEALGLEYTDPAVLI